MLKACPSKKYKKKKIFWEALIKMSFFLYLSFLKIGVAYITFIQECIILFNLYLANA